MKLRLGTRQDLPQLEAIIEAAVEQMREDGIPQWQKGRGIAAKMFQAGKEIAKSLGFSNMRIDTHEDNRRMRHALEKAGYQYCGKIYLVDGAEAGEPRVAYQLRL